MKTKLFTIVILLFSSALFSQVPQTMDYSGKLTDDNGSFINGQVNITFRLYDTETGGTALWEETQTNVNVSNGFFHVQLGSVTAFPDTLFDNADLWLGMEVNTDGEMAPRNKLASVPFSQSSSEWIKNGNDIYRLDGNVGIGTDNPVNRIDIEASIDDLGIHIDNNSTDSREWALLSSGGASGIGINKFHIRDVDAGKERFVIDGNGNVGIGTESPNSKLDVIGGISISSPQGKAILNNYDGDNNTSFNISGNPYSNTRLFSIHASTSGTQGSVLEGSIFDVYGHNGVMYIPGIDVKNNGWVGLGTTSPFNAFHLQTQSGNYVFTAQSLYGVHLKTDLNSNNGSIELWGTGTSYIDFTATIGADYDRRITMTGGKNLALLGGNIIIGEGEPKYLFEVNGEAAKANGSTWINHYDFRIMDVKNKYEKGLEEIVKLNPISFLYKQSNQYNLSSDQINIGFNAQEAKKIFPEAVKENTDGYLDFDMHCINVAVINAIKELNDKIEEQQTQIEELQAKIK